MKFNLAGAIFILSILAGCKKSVPHSVSLEQSSSMITHLALSRDGAPFYAIQISGDRINWVLLLEGDYFFRGFGSSIEGGTVLDLSGLGGRPDLMVPITKQGAMIFVSKDGSYKELPHAYLPGSSLDKIYEGRLDVTRYPELVGINSIFEADQKRIAEQPAHGDAEESE